MVFFALLCYNDLSKNRKVDAKMDYQKWAQEVAQKIKIKELEVAKRNRGKIPYTAENGAWNDCSGEKIGWWTNGFWGGMMWQLYKATGEEIYRENAEETDEPWEFLYLHFDGSAVFPFFEKLTQHCGGIISIDAQTSCIQKALALHTRMISGGHLQPYEGGEFLYGFLCGLLRHVLHPAAFHTESTASQAALLMEKEFATIGSINEVAKRLHISSEHLSRSFHSEWGIAPVQYLNRKRIQSAMNDLLGSNDTIEVIAVKNGFANGNYFAKVFRRYTKMTPGEYRCKKAGQIRTLSV